MTPAYRRSRTAAAAHHPRGSAASRLAMPAEKWRGGTLVLRPGRRPAGEELAD